MPSTRSSPRRRALLTALLLTAIAVGVATYVVAANDTTASGPLVVDPSVGPDDPAPDPDDLAAPGIAEPGDPPPPFTATTLEGGTVDLADFSDRPVIINFWASWCFPCRAEFPLLREVHEGGEVAVIGVVFNDIPSDAERFADEMDARWPQALDSGGEIARAYGVRSIPRTFFVSSDGIIEASAYGFTEQSFRRHLATLE